MKIHLLPPAIFPERVKLREKEESGLDLERERKVGNE